jgi:hypothetical protein
MESKMAKAATVVKETIDNETGEIVKLAPNKLDEFSGGKGHVIVKRVSVPVLQWPEGMTLTFSPLTKIEVGKVIEGKKDDDDKPAKPAHIMQVMGVGGSVRLLVVGTVIEGNLKENYPNDSYVGKWFAATKFEPNRARKQRYATYEISEIEDPR